MQHQITRSILLFNFSLLTFVGLSQSDSLSHHGHAHHHNEIGIANAIVFLAAEDEFAYGLHAHFLHAIAASNWSAGFSAERIFDDHRHQTFSLIIAFQPAEGFTLSAAPGWATENGDFSKGQISLHIECTYELELGEFHIGPLAEVAYEPEGMHYALGLHLGFGF